MYSTPVYSYVGQKTPCINNEQCAISAECNHDILDRNSGIGICTLRIPDKTVFNIKY